MRKLLVVVFAVLAAFGAGAQQADMTIAKTASPAVVNAGDEITYTLQVTNIGTEQAPSIRVVDSVPANTTFRGASLIGGGSAGGCAPPQVTSTGAVECFLTGLGPQGTRSFAITVRVNPDAAGATITNTATVTTTASESSTGNNSSSVQTQVSPIPPTTADLSVEKFRPDALFPYVGRGEVATFTIIIRNNGPLAAQNVTLTDVLPAPTTFESLTAPAGFTCTTPAQGTNGTVTCTAPSLADQAAATFTLGMRLTATATGTISNSATVSSTTPDPDSSDLASSSSVTATNPGADLRVTKTTTQLLVTAGDNIGYTVEVANIGSQLAPVVRMLDFVPANTTFVSAFLIGGGSAGGCGPPQVTSSGAVECVLNALSPQGSRSFAMTVRVNPTAVGATITNTAGASSSAADPDTSNNSSTIQTQVSPIAPSLADISVFKQRDHAFVGPGDTRTFTITVRNAGPIAAQTFTMNDAVPPQTTFQSLVVPAGFTCSTPAQGGTGTITCSTAAFADQATATFMLTVRANASISGTIANTATVSSSTPDPNASNNSSTATMTATESTGADLRLSKSANPASANRGDTIIYSVSVTNIGSSGAGNVAIDDPVPAGTTFLSVEEPPGTAANCFDARFNNNVVRCTINGLGPGDTFTIRFGVRVNDNAPSTITNVANVSGSSTDPVSSNNTAAAATAVSGPAVVAAIPMLDIRALLFLALLLTLLGLRRAV